jgi:uncharacterized protein (TIGR00299 family) protein
VSRVLYFDCFSGISGDMALGALLDAGLPFDDLKAALGSLALGDAHVHARKVLRAGVSATKFSVHEHAGGDAPHAADCQNQDHHVHGSAPHAAHPHRHLSAINKLIDTSALSATARERAKQMFRRLGEAEAAIHQMPIEKVHLHEVGALDSIIDIVGIASPWSGRRPIGRVLAAECRRGWSIPPTGFPVPAPATVALLGDAPVAAGAVQKTRHAHRGADCHVARLVVRSDPAMSIERVGYGAGDRDEPATPNALRVMIWPGEIGASTERVCVIECEIDDMNPQIFGVVMERLYAAGALEVFYVPVQMKKNRPGTLLSVVAPPEQRSRMTEVIFRETTTIGLRYSEVDRECLDRQIVPVETPLGTVRFKIASRGGNVINAVPEFEDCAKLAAAHNLPVKEVQALAVRSYKP